MRDGRTIGMALLALAALTGLLLIAWLLWPTAPAVPTTSDGPVPIRSEVAPAVQATADSAALMQRAREQLARGALIAPPGANAVETYLAVLQGEADHAAARAALIEMQPVVADGIRGALAGADWAEAGRLLALLRRLDPGSVLLDPLTAELEQRQAQAAAAEQARLVAAATPEPPVPVAPSPDPAPANPPAAASAPAPAPTPAASLPEPAPQSVADAAASAEPVLPPPTAPRPASPARPGVRETPARLLNNPAVSYPPQARRQRLEGWVEVEVQIDAGGTVASARVLRAEPPGVFDREALRTAQRWRFAPREVDGAPVASTARRRVAFSLGS